MTNALRVVFLVAVTSVAGPIAAQEGEQQRPQQDRPVAAPEFRPLVEGQGGGAAGGADCSNLPDYSTLQAALRKIVVPGDKTANGGLGNHMWAVTVNRGGIICTIARSGEEFGDQWPGSRAIAAKKAFAANAFSLPNFALSTANLYWPSQPGNPLYGIETGDPVDVRLLYKGEASNWGTDQDPLVGNRLGGVTLFGGGLPLYDRDGKLVGGLGLSGDESCTDHIIAWKLRYDLGLDNVPDGVTPEKNDNIIHDLVEDPKKGRQTSSSGYGHPTCSPAAERIVQNLDETHPHGTGD